LSEVPSFWIVLGADSAEKLSRTCWSGPRSSGALPLLPEGVVEPLLLLPAAAAGAEPPACLANSLDWMRLAAMSWRARTRRVKERGGLGRRRYKEEGLSSVVRVGGGEESFGRVGRAARAAAAAEVCLG
jgi:hypothetical protein